MKETGPRKDLSLARQEAQLIRDGWSRDIGNIENKLALGGLSKGKVQRLNMTLGVLRAKFDGRDYPGRTARRHVYRVASPLVEWDLRDAFMIPRNF